MNEPRTFVVDNFAIHPETIAEVKEKTDIVDVISEYVVLRKRGKNLIGLCPFHEEKTPSFTVSQSKQMYYCFGCGAGGNGIKFLMELHKQSFAEAVLNLAQRYQVPIKTLLPQQRQEIQRQLSLSEQMYEILAVAKSFYQHALRQPGGKLARQYLQEERKLKENTIQTFELGYAPEGWETLYRYLVEQKRYPLALVEQVGLIRPRQSGSGYYDQFRDRLMIPIYDVQGRVIAFGSRTLGTEEPKYLNSPETALFDKSKVLFALNLAKQHIIKQNQVLVVEGYFDAIALHEAGINHVVATLGTAFSQEQLKQVLRYTESKQVVFNFDADQAGIKATERAINEMAPLIYSGQVQLKILSIPLGKDADEFIKSSPDAPAQFASLINQASWWFPWQIEQIVKLHDLKQPDQFPQASQKIIKLLSQLQDTNQQIYYLHYCAEVLSQGDASRVRILEDNLVNQVKQAQKKLAVKNYQIFPEHPTEISSVYVAENILLSLYLHCPQHRQEIEQGLEERGLIFTLPTHRFLWQIIIDIQNNFLLSLEDPQNQLISLVQDRVLNFPDKVNHLQSLFYFNETQKETLSRPSWQIGDALNCLEKIKWQKYKSYCIKNLQTCQSESEQFYWGEQLGAIAHKLEELEQYITPL